MPMAVPIRDLHAKLTVFRIYRIVAVLLLGSLLIESEEGDG